MVFSVFKQSKTNEVFFDFEASTDFIIVQTFFWLFLFWFSTEDQFFGKLLCDLIVKLDFKNTFVQKKKCYEYNNNVFEWSKSVI